MRKCALFFQLFSRFLLLLINLPNYIGKFAFFYPHYKKKLEITEFAYHFSQLSLNLTDSTYNYSLFQVTHKLQSLTVMSFNSIVEVIKLLHDVSKANTNQFAIYYPYYKDKLVSISTQTFIYAANFFCFSYNSKNLLVISLLTYNNNDNIKFY